MNDGADLPRGRAAQARLVAVGPTATPNPGVAPATPLDLRLRRAAELIEEVAFDIAGRDSPETVSRLIEMAADLERMSKGLPPRNGPRG